jgi:hypothetical protein
MGSERRWRAPGTAARRRGVPQRTRSTNCYNKNGDAGVVAE